MGLGDFYRVLPTPDQAGFKVPYYWEAVKNFKGVRCIPSAEWLESFPASLADYPKKVGFPSYFIPIVYGRYCYGFVMKGVYKPTPRFCTNFLLPGCEDVRPGKWVLLAEGIKDVGFWRSISAQTGVAAVPLLSSVPSVAFLSWLKTQGCPVMYVPDGDEYCDSHIQAFAEKSNHTGLRGFSFRLEGLKDFGAWYEGPVHRATVLSEAKRCLDFMKGLHYD